MPPETPPSLIEIAAVFLRLGTVAFGGPAAHLAMMEAEFVRKRKWLTHQEYMDMIGAANLIPGPSSSEVAIHVGLRRGGWLGMLVAGICFILPAALIVGAIAWFYVRFGSLPSFQAALYGIKPVVVAVVAQAIVILGVKVLDNWTKRLLSAACLGVSLAGLNPLVVLLGAGVLLSANALRVAKSWKAAIPVLLLLASIAAVAALPLAWQELWKSAGHADPLAVFLYFLKLGSVVYGSGYVLLAFLEGDLITRWHWLTKGQLLDAVAVGQFTPGPVFTTATFIGYLLAGVPGAVLGTVGIFLPAFFFVAVTGRLLPGLRKSPVSAGLLDGVNAAALALMASVVWTLGREAIRDAPTAILAAASLALLVRWRMNSAWLIGVGAIVGVLMHALR